MLRMGPRVAEGGHPTTLAAPRPVRGDNLCRSLTRAQRNQRHALTPLLSLLNEYAKRPNPKVHIPVKVLIRARTYTIIFLPQELDLCTMRPEDQDFTAEFKLELLPPAAASTQASEQQAQAAQQPEQPQQPEMGCVVLWFDTPFSSRHCRDHPVLLSTSPYDTTTHWAQTLLTLRKPVPLMVHGAGDGGNGSGAGAGATQQRPGAREVTGRVSMVRSRSQFRSLDIALQYRAVLSDGSVVEDAQLYHMNVMTPS